MKSLVLTIVCLIVVTCPAFCNLVEDGATKQAKGDLDGAIADYTKAIELEGTNYIAYNNRGMAKQAKGDLDRAILDLTRAIELKPDYAPNYINRGFVKQTKFDFDGAIVDFNKANELKPGDNYIQNMLWFAKEESTKSKPDLYVRRGIAKQEANGDLNGAIADYSKAIELKPNFAWDYKNRGWCEFLKKDFDGATNDATCAIQLNSTNRSFYDTRGWARYEKGDVAGALDDCKKAVGLSQINTWAAVETQGLVNFITGDYHMAFEQWNNSFQNDTTKQYLLPFIEKAKAKEALPR